MLIFEQPFYRVGDEIISPVVDILMVVPAPAFIKHTCVDKNVVLPLTTEVCVAWCVLPLIVGFPLRNIRIILLHIL